MTQKNLKIILCNPRGFCAGVTRAIKTVEKALEKYPYPVYVRHEIVHNKHVVNELKEKGAKAILCEKKLDFNIPQIVVDSTRQKIAVVADNFNQSPSKTMNLVGVTGTNGKTTVTHLIQKIQEAKGEKCALIGTLGYKLSSDDDYLDPNVNTLIMNSLPLAPCSLLLAPCPTLVCPPSLV